MADSSLESISRAIENNPYGDHVDEYDEILDSEDRSWEDLSDARHLHLTGVLYNFADQKSDLDGFERIIELNNRIEHRGLAPAHTAQRYYQLGNAHAGRHNLTMDDEKRFSFFDSEDLIEAIGYCRASLATRDLQKIPKKRVSQSYVNFANLLSQTGRTSEALKHYNSAVEVSPDFGMALGNRGQCKWEYANLLFESSHVEKYLHSAYNDLSRAVEQSGDLFPAAKEKFQRMERQLDNFSDSRFSFENEEEYSLGETDEEARYKQWVLENHLFLNPLNDISTHTATAHDYFHLPNMTIPINDEFPYPGIYNQMKQEFVSARYFYYEGLVSSGPHFSDKDVEMPDTLDYTIVGYHTEQLKSSLRLSYSIFDKIANFLNLYYNLGHDRVKFGNFWYPDATYSDEVHDNLKNTDNWALNALYWLKKDFHHAISKRDGESNIIVAHELKSIRDAVEHNYIKVFDGNIVAEPPSQSDLGIEDTAYESISQNELEEVALEMLRLARAGLFYLSFAVHIEEYETDDESDKKAAPVHSFPLPDSFKK